MPINDNSDKEFDSNKKVESGMQTNEEKEIKKDLSSDCEDIEKRLEKLSVLELLALVKHLEEKWGVSAAASVVAGPSDSNKTTIEEPSSFEVEITEVANKVATIKLLKELKNLSLGDAKAALENLPYSMGEFDSKSKAEEVINKLKEISASASIKSN